MKPQTFARFCSLAAYCLIFSHAQVLSFQSSPVWLMQSIAAGTTVNSYIIDGVTHVTSI